MLINVGETPNSALRSEDHVPRLTYFVSNLCKVCGRKAIRIAEVKAVVDIADPSEWKSDKSQFIIFGSVAVADDQSATRDKALHPVYLMPIQGARSLPIAP